MRKKVNYEAPLNMLGELFTEQRALDWIVGKFLDMSLQNNPMLENYNTKAGYDYRAIAKYYLDQTLEALRDEYGISLINDMNSKEDAWGLYSTAEDAIERSQIEHDEARQILLNIGYPITYIWGEKD